MHLQSWQGLLPQHSPQPVRPVHRAPPPLGDASPAASMLSRRTFMHGAAGAAGLAFAAGHWKLPRARDINSGVAPSLGRADPDPSPQPDPKGKSQDLAASGDLR
jgi:hypothetical protein